MKNWKILVCLLSVVVFILAGTACQQSGAAKSTEMRGALYKSDDSSGLYFRSGGKRYIVESQEDLSAMVGKTVTLHGAVSEKDGQYSVMVNAVKVQE